MACEFEIRLCAGQYPHGAEAALEALDQVEQLEDQLSVFRPHSELSQINAAAAERAVPVEPRLFELLQLAMQVSRETGGAYDITAGPLWEAWGFAPPRRRRPRKSPSRRGPLAASAAISSNWTPPAGRSASSSRACG